MKAKYYLYFTTIFFASSCATIKDASIRQQLTSSKCYQANEYHYTEKDLPISLSKSGLETSPLSKKISQNSLYIANIIGIIPYLKEYNDIKSSNKQLTLEERVHLLEIEQVMDQKINNASLIVSAVSSELDCEEERTSQIANYIKDKEDDLESKLTIGAIVLGATGAILTGGVIKDETASNVVGISTGVGEAMLGLTMLFNKRKVDFDHQRNILTDIWLGPTTSKLIPAFIWYYLTNDYNGQPSLRIEIIEKWDHFGQIDNDSEKLANLYFGKGGKYTADQLSNRANMYDQLESQIYLLKQKLMTLANEIDEI